MLGKWLPWTLKLLLSGALIWFLVDKVGVEDAWRRAQAVDGVMLAAAALMLWLQVPLGTLRWMAVLRAMAAPLAFGRSLAIMYSGMFFNQALPSAVGGDAVRVWMTHREGFSLSRAFNSVMLERLATVFGLVLLVTLIQPFLLLRTGALPGAWVFPALTVAGICGIAVIALLDRLPERWRRWRIARMLAGLAADTRRVFLKGRNLWPTLALVLIGHANLAFVVWILALGLGIPVTLLDCLVLVPPVILAMTLPISVGGWGVREAGMVATFGLIGVPEASALVLSLLYGLVTVAVNLPGGLFWLARGGGRHQSEEAGA